MHCSRYTCTTPVNCKVPLARPCSMEGSSLIVMVLSHLSAPLITGRGIGTETFGVGDVFSPDDVWFASDTYTNCALIYDLHLEVWLMGCAFCIECPTDGERDGVRRSTLSGHWLSCTGCWQYSLNMKLLMCGLLFLHLPPYDVNVNRLSVWKTDWTTS